MKFDLSRLGAVTVARLEGPPRRGDFDHLLDGLEAAAVWRPGAPLLVDKTRYDTSGMTVSDVHRVAAVCSDRREIFGRSRVAIVVDRDLEFGMNRMFLAFVKWDAEAEIFRERDEGEAWLTGGGDWDEGDGPD